MAKFRTKYGHTAYLQPVKANLSINFILIGAEKVVVNFEKILCLRELVSLIKVGGIYACDFIENWRSINGETRRLDHL